MAFDGRDYLDALPMRRSLYHPRNGHTGVVLGRNLRGAIAVARHRGQQFGAMSWQNDLVSPEIAQATDPDRVIRSLSYEIFWRDDRHVPSHFTHGHAHFAFSVPAYDGELARVRLSAGNVEVSVLDQGDAVTFDLSPDGSPRINEGVLSPFEARGGAYEGLANVEFDNTSLDQDVFLTLEAFGRGTFGDPPNLFTIPLRIDSVSVWLESVG